MLKLHFVAGLGVFCLLAGCGGQEPDDQTDGRSQGGAPPISAVSCDIDDECDDGNACNGVESCDSGTCRSGKPVNCNDSVACTTDRCIPESGTCEHLPPDADGDGHADAACRAKDDSALGDDCDDEDPTRFPTNSEVCTLTFIGDSDVAQGDGKDEDCDPTTFGSRDFDKDGFVSNFCFNLDDDGSQFAGTDCNDSIASINPATAEVCNYYDDNCDAQIDEGVNYQRYGDPDGDGYGGIYDPDTGIVVVVPIYVCSGAVRVAEKEIDCAPDDPLVSPGRDELCDGIDNNCNDEIDENVVPALWFRDFDGDGYGNPASGTKSTCENISQQGWSLFSGDCSDNDATVNPGQQELCDGKDNDCNPGTAYLIAPGNTEDDDKDSVADPICGTSRPDCNDLDETIYPGALELCDGIDNDCNGVADNQTSVVKWYFDLDGDGFGVTTGVVSSCERIEGRVTRAGDCADDEPLRNPDRPDDCSGVHGIDDDCDGTIDEGEALQAFYRDQDGDAYGAGVPKLSCSVPVNYVGLGGDCDDADQARNPGAAEVCAPTDSIDQDCDGKIDCLDNQCSTHAACQALYGLAVVSPTGPLSALTSDTFSVTVQLNDSSATPVQGASLVVSGEPGALVPSAPVVTNASGQATFTIGVGLAEGPYTFTVGSGETLPLLFTVEAELPEEGTVWTVVNRAATSGNDVTGTFGPNARVYYPRDIDAVENGDVYVASYYRVLKLDAVGQLAIVAGNGTGTVSGDGLAAPLAGLGVLTAIAVDLDRQRLYIANNTTVRVVVLDGSPSTIHHAIGGGLGPIPGPAELASIGTLRDLELTRSGELLVSTSLGVFSYDPDSKQLAQTGLLVGDYDTEYVGLYNTTGVRMRQGDERLLLWGYLAGGDFGAYGLGVAGWDGGAPFHMFGQYPAGGTVGVQENAPISQVALNGGNLWDAYEDTAGNLIFLPDVTGAQNSLWKIDTATKRLHRFAGTGVAEVGEEYVDKLEAGLLGDIVFDIGPDGDLWLAEYDSYGRIRRIRGAETGTLTNLQLELLTNDGAQYWPGQALGPVSSRVTTSLGAFSVETPVHQAPHSGWEALVHQDATNIDGVAYTQGYTELTAGTYSLETQLLALDREVLDSGILSYEVVAPPSGSVSTWFNVTHASTAMPAPYVGKPALTSRFSTIYDLEVGSDGSIYFIGTGGGYGVYRITPSGYLELVAGGKGNGNTGDYGPALEAQLYSPDRIILDEERQLLFIDQQTDPSIRVVDLKSGIIYPFAGTGTETGYGVPVIDRAPWSPGAMVLEGDGLYLSTTNGVDVVDLSESDPTIENWIQTNTGACASASLALYSCATGGTEYCSLAFRPDGKAYMAGRYCGTSMSGVHYGIALVAADGTPEEFVAGGGNLTTYGPYSALLATVVAPTGLSLDAQGRLYFLEESKHRLRRLDPNGTLHVVAGSASNESGGIDFVPGQSARFLNPRETHLHTDGSLLILDHSNYAIRRYWP